jgi:hypothetical protein
VKVRPGAAVLLFGCAVALVFAALLLGGCGTSAVATGSPSPSPSPAPAWLSQKAAHLAAQWGDPRPAAAYWGLLSDPELGRLTSSGPNDPSHKAYAIVLVGDYSKMYTMVSWPSPPASPLPPIKWMYSLFTTAHEDAGSFGYGINDFDVGQYPGLQPLPM